MKTSLDLGVKYLPINLTESTFHCNDVEKYTHTEVNSVTAKPSVVMKQPSTSRERISG